VNRVNSLPTGQKKLVLAFNKKAQEEFSTRMGSNMEVSVKTFHAYCMGHLKRDATQFGFQFKDPQLIHDSNLSLVAKVFQAPPNSSWESLNVDDELYNWCELSCHTDYVKKLLDEAIGTEHEIVVNTYRAVVRVREYLVTNNLFTFASAVRHVAEYRRNIYYAPGHIMVDEFQDVDNFQMQIILQLCRNKYLKSVTVVGDPNQRIYEWRGALANAFSHFKNAIESDQIISNRAVEVRNLTTNFRSHDEVIDYAEGICKVGMKGVKGKGGVLIGSRMSRRDKIVEWVGEPSKQKAILCRINRDCLEWSLHLIQSGIRHQMHSTLDFWKQGWVKRIIELKIRKENAGEQIDFDKDVRNSAAWVKEIAKPRYKSVDRYEELMADYNFLSKLTLKEITDLQTKSNDPEGIQISTIHRTKGMEFDDVVVSSVDGRVMSDTYVYYVACTRARNRLMIARNDMSIAR
jgi:superfamily I DNA/RNA helicase